MSAFEKLTEFHRETCALAEVAGRLGWDQETTMPEGAGAQRAEEMGAMEGVLHQRRTDPRVGDWLAEAQAPDAAGETALKLIRKEYVRANKIPTDLAKAIAKITSSSQGIWANARAEDDFAAFAPTFEEVLRLKREEGQALAEGGDTYDAMLDDYEPETSAAQIAEIFDNMRPRLVALRAAVLDQPEPAGVTGTFDAAKQMELSTKIAGIFGYDFNRGRIDKAVHPFSSGSGDDVRITTRTSETDPFNCLYSTIHEVGHACYEQNISTEYNLTALGGGVSMGVHESQSRIYENQLGRSRAFTGWLYREMRDVFGDFGIADEDAFYAAVNRVQRGYIRTEADELQYNLHIMMRFDLERALISGDLQVSDLEAAWNDRFEADFGFAVDKASNGVLQDVHWPVGLFGYFPTYALGNVYAGCLYDRLTADVPELETQLANGDLSAATNWLRDNLQVHGRLRGPRDTIAHACGSEPSHEPLLSYLEAKFKAIYALN